MFLRCHWHSSTSTWYYCTACTTTDDSKRSRFFLDFVTESPVHPDFDINLTHIRGRGHLATMKLNTFSLLTFVASASAVSVQLIENCCPEGRYLTLSVNATQDMNGPFVLPPGQAYECDIVGKGNTAIVTTSPDIFSSDVGKVSGSAYIVSHGASESHILTTIRFVDGAGHDN